MELYHLDWEATKQKGDDRLLAIILPTPDESAFVDKVAEAFRGGNYRKVATFTGHRPEDVFRLTQNIDDSWAETAIPGMVPVSDNPARSTSVGDVIIDDSGRHLAFASVGLVEFGRIST
jgi:hypothetical protein